MLKPQPPGIPLPEPSEFSVPFWQHLTEGKLFVQRCNDCSHYVFLPTDICSNCQSLDLEWVQSLGTGTVESYTVIHRPQTPAFVIPYVVAVVELDEHWHMFAGVVNCEPEDVVVGMRVKLFPVRMNKDITLPYFEQAAVG